MKRKIIFAVAVVLVLSVSILSFFIFSSLNKLNDDEKYCRSDSDCACGIRFGTGDCFYGNKNFVDVSRQCPDFCNGIVAHLEIKCIYNQCEQINKLNQ
jgi:hypothetical protein